MTYAVYDCCIPYKAVPIPGVDGANSNSFVGWMLTSCIVPENQFGILWLPNGRVHPGVLKGRPDCVKEKLKGVKRAIL